MVDFLSNSPRRRVVKSEEESKENLFDDGPRSRSPIKVPNPESKEKQASKRIEPEPIENIIAPKSR